MLRDAEGLEGEEQKKRVGRVILKVPKETGEKEWDLNMAVPVESSVKLDQYHWEDFSEFYFPPNPHLTSGVAQNGVQPVYVPPLTHLVISPNGFTGLS